MILVPPKNVNDNLLYRADILKKATTHSVFRKELMTRCEKDPVFWIDSFVWQFNPNSIGEHSRQNGPFLSWPFQEEAIHDLHEAIETRKPRIIKKSREMGASWMCVLLFDWYFLFKKWKKFLCISRNAESVDDSSEPDSLFWKLDHVHNHLPGWMKGGIRRKRMKLRNTETNSSITGTASTGKAGIGGRATAILVDEFTLIEEDFEVLQGTASTSDCRIFNFTHRGLATAAYHICENTKFQQLTLHWSQHPDKRKGLYRVVGGKVEVLDKDYEYPEDFKFVMDGTPIGGPFPGLRSPWYDKKCEDIATPRGIAMDLDINPLGTKSQAVDPIMIRDRKAEFCTAPFWQGDIHFDVDTGRVIDLVPNPAGRLKLWLHLYDGKPRPAKYTLGADVATGTGASPSCLDIFNAEMGEQVGEYADANIEPKEFAALAVGMAWLFKDHDGNGAALAWESNGPGINFGIKVIALGYRNVFRRYTEQKIGAAFESDIPGWTPTSDNKRILILDFFSALKTREYVPRSEDMMNETVQFNYNDKGTTIEHSGEVCLDPTGARVNHGDRVIAAGLSWKMAKGKGFKKTTEKPELKPGSLAWRRLLADNDARKRKAWA